MRIGFVVGLTAEARIAECGGYVVRAGGGTPDGAAAAARSLLAEGVDALISFGLAGGLDPALRPGTVVVPEAVLSGQERFAADRALAGRFGGVTGHLMLAGEAVVASAANKHALWRSSGAHAVDLESGAVARAATEAGRPFAVVRAICDPADRTLPPAALMALDAEGAIVAWQVLGSVLRRPSQIWGLIRLGRDAAAGRAALLRVIGGEPGDISRD